MRLFRFRNKIKVVTRNTENSGRLQSEVEVMPLQSETCKKTYCPPKLNRLTLDQANLLLIGQATCGDQGARELLNVVYPPPEPVRNHNVRANFEDEEPAQIKPGTSCPVRRALTAFQSTREDFRRFIRG